MSDCLRLGFVGAGGIAERHLGVLAHFADVAIAAFADTDAARADLLAERHGARAYPDADAMIGAERLDALYICVPPFAHGAPERAAVAAGLPFFVEKPVSLDLAIGEAIAAEVARTGLVTAVGYHWRYLDVLDEVRERLGQAPPALIAASWLDGTPPPRWWWRSDTGGGQVVEQATHLLDLARVLAGEAESVTAFASHLPRPDFPDLDVPTAGTATIRFRSGTLMTLTNTILLGHRHRVGFDIFAPHLALELTDTDLTVDAGEGRIPRDTARDPVEHEDRDFIDAVRGGPNRIRCPYPEALATHRLALAVVEAARTGEVVRP